MRVHNVVLLSAIAFAASANAASIGTQTQVDSPALVRAAQGDQIFLRIRYTEDEEGNEERGFATFKEKTKALLGSSTYSEKTLARWVRDNKSPKNALTRLQLDEAGNKLLEKPQFKTWFTYMTMANKQNPEAAMIAALSTRYSDDVLSKMIIAAKKAPDTKDLATKLQAGQASMWLRRDKSPADTFKLFGLKADANLLTNPTLNSWVKYLDDFNTKNPKEKTTMVETFTTYYGEEGLYQMLKTAKEVGATKKIATDLQQAQLANWLATKQNPRDVSRWLGMKGSATDSVERVMYRKYLSDYNAKFVQPAA